MLSDMDGNLLSLLLMGIHENPLDEVVSILITSNVNQRNSWSVRVRCGNYVEVSVKELNATNLETFLNNLGSILINAIAVGVDKNVVNDTSFVRRSTMFTQVLDAPVAELTVSNEVDVGDDFFDRGSLLLLDAVFEDVLNDQASSLTECNLMPHAAKSFVDVGHDLRRLTTPS